ncbi:hypothetical protein OF83DRAFT_1065961 [Amylostereum chailletii]|nr:hypothetical protein OF83DRAFT_1065961 [Amylostereum chailletii]
MAPPSTVRSTISPLQRVHASTAILQTKQFSIRTDVHFSSISNTMTALLELPGVKKTDLNVNLIIDSFTKVKQVVVSGKTTTSFSEYGQEERDGHSKITRERKFGDFVRRYNVPFETKASDVYIDLQDGILTMRVLLGPPLPINPPQAILIQ